MNDVVTWMVSIAFVLAACSGDSSHNARPDYPAVDKPAAPDANAMEMTKTTIDAGAAAAIDAGAVTAIHAAELDAGAVAVVDAGAATPDAAVKTRQCFCFSWVHLDQNGENCFTTKAKCDAEFKSYGRQDKIPCSSEQRVTCGSWACAEHGQQCYGR